MTFKTQNLTPPPARIDAGSKTIQPLTSEGDDYFGLSAGSNGISSSY